VNSQPVLGRGLLAAVLALGLSSPAAADKDREEDRTGTVTGMAVEKGGYWIDVKADGTEKPRRYYCGSDPVALKAVKNTEVGSRVRLEWRFREVYRVVKIEVLKPPAKKE
jgi:hypothetical protein